MRSGGAELSRGPPFRTQRLAKTDGPHENISRTPPPLSRLHTIRLCLVRWRRNLVHRHESVSWEMDDISLSPHNHRKHMPVSMQCRRGCGVPCKVDTTPCCSSCTPVAVGPGPTASTAESVPSTTFTLDSGPNFGYVITSRAASPQQNSEAD